MPRWIIGDTETTTQGPTAKVVEIAWVEIDDSLNVVDRCHSLIDPQCPISAGAGGVHGIRIEDVLESPTIEEYFDIVLGQRITGPSVLIAHKVDFDLPFFKPFMPQLVGTMCTMRLAKKLLPEAENFKLTTLAYQFNLPRQTAHRAAGDVEMCLDLLRLIVERSGGAALEELMVECAVPIVVEKWPFGKHKDKPLNFDMGYVKWALKNMKELDTDLRLSLEAVAAA